MIPVLSLHTTIPLLFTPLSRPFHLKPPPLSPPQPPPPPTPPLQRSRRPHYCLPIQSLSNSSNQFQENPFPQQPRTLFPGGYKRPEIKVPTLVLQLTPDEALGDGNGNGVSDALDLVDEAVSKSVGIVVLSDGEGGSGKRLYEAACVLKSIIRDRAYLLIAERVDIATAVNASGVVLSDQGLPAIVARNMMVNARSDSIILPLVARNVQSASAMSVATNADGADFVICNMGEEQLVDGVPMSLNRDVKIPVFVVCSIKEEEATAFSKASKMIRFGASGLVVSLRDMNVLGSEVLDKLLNDEKRSSIGRQNELHTFSKSTVLKANNDHHEKGTVSSFPGMDDREKNLKEKEKNLLMEAINVIQKAAPLMEEVSLLIDAVSQIDEPFLLVIVGEFNSGKSSFINALLGERYLREGVVPTTNEITFLRYSKSDVNNAQVCERHPDGQYICYLPAPILKEMTVVDTPGTNVILQRQQRLTEEFIPRADLLLFVISADRPLTESEVGFLRYTQQWKKKVVFVLNKSDIYQNASELEEATSFIRENAQKLLNVEQVTLYPVSARYALEAKLSDSYDVGQDHGELSVSDFLWRITSFYEFEKFLYDFLDRSTSKGKERIRLKLETPIRVAEQLISSCETLMRKEHQNANKDLNAVLSIVNSVNDYAIRMESESISWRRQILSLIDNTKLRILEVAASTLRLSNLDFVAVYVFKGEKSSSMPGTSRVQVDIISPALLDARRLLGEYVNWLHSTNSSQARAYKESFEKRWPSLLYSSMETTLERFDMPRKVDELSLKVIENFNASAASKSFEQEIREVFLGAFGGLGVAGLSASLLTSLLETTLEDLLALGLCSAGGFLAISNFPAQRQVVMDKVSKTVDALALDVEEAMQKDLSETISSLENFVNTISKPYQESAQQRLDKIVEIQKALANVDRRLRDLQIDIQNLHVS